MSNAVGSNTSMLSLFSVQPTLYRLLVGAQLSCTMPNPYSCQIEFYGKHIFLSGENITMKSGFILAWLCAVSVLPLAGCGGSTSQAGLVASQNAVFEGTYVAPFTDSGANTDTGEFAIHIDSNGAITGRYIDSTNLTTSAITSGQITFTSMTTTSDTGLVTVTDAAGTLTGTFTLSSGVLSGTVATVANGLIVHYNSGLASIANGNSFAGWYNGTFTQNGTSGSPANSLSLIIDPNGNITALSTNNIVGNAGTNTFTGTIVSVTGVTDFPSLGGGSSTGTLTLSGNKLTGSVNNPGLTNLIAVNLTTNT
jgi:hypothetical protein